MGQGGSGDGSGEAPTSRPTNFIINVLAQVFACVFDRVRVIIHNLNYSACEEAMRISWLLAQLQLSSCAILLAVPTDYRLFPSQTVKRAGCFIADHCSAEVMFRVRDDNAERD